MQISLPVALARQHTRSTMSHPDVSLLQVPVAPGCGVWAEGRLRGSESTLALDLSASSALPSPPTATCKSNRQAPRVAPTPAPYHNQTAPPVERTERAEESKARPTCGTGFVISASGTAITGAALAGCPPAVRSGLCAVSQPPMVREWPRPRGWCAAPPTAAVDWEWPRGIDVASRRCGGPAGVWAGAGGSVLGAGESRAPSTMVCSGGGGGGPGNGASSPCTPSATGPGGRAALENGWGGCASGP